MPLLGRVAPALLVASILLVGPARAAGAGYVNPFSGDTVSVGRTDMGVDLCLTPGQPIRAIGDGVVTGVMRDWYEKQPYIWYELTGGPDAGRYVYVAEQLDHLAAVGQTLHAGDVIGLFARRGSCLETGWSQAGGATVAQTSAGGYSEGDVTAAGISFARLLISLGVPGTFQLSGPVTRAPATRPTIQTAARTRTTTRVTSRTRTTKRATKRPLPRPAPIPTAPRTTLAPPTPTPTPAPRPAPATPSSGASSGSTHWWDMPGDPFSGG